jgi:hypothetical protein
MYGENGLAIDLGAVESVIDEADIVVIGFEFCNERLLFDLRADEISPPLVEVVDPVPGAAERVEWLNERRPDVTPPDQFVFFVWPHTVDYLADSRLVQGALRRVRREQSIDLSEDIGSVLADLRRLERDDQEAALTGGPGYETIWPPVAE